MQIIDNSSIQDSAMPREVEIFRGPQPKSIRKNVIKRVELEELELVNKRYDRVYQVGRDCHDITNVLSADIIKKKYEDGKLVYYITYQFYDCTLNEFMDEENIEKSSLIIDILKGSTDGLMHFHDKGYTHRNIQPDNIVICKNVSKSEYAGLIANISSAKPLKENDKQTVSGNYANYKYSAPELVIYEETDFENDRKAKIEMRKREVTSKVDIFSMGLVYYFAFTNKKYPFKNKKQKPSLYLLDDSDFFKETKFNVPLAIQLIGAMLQYKSEKRPNCRNILNHVLFWNKERQINFLGVVSKLINGKEQKTTKARDSMNADKIFGKYIQWQDYLEPDVKKTVNKLRKQPDDVSGLLRAIKNFVSINKWIININVAKACSFFYF